MLAVAPDQVDVERAIERYREQGYARLGKVISDHALADLRARADEIMLTIIARSSGLVNNS